MSWTRLKSWYSWKSRERLTSCCVSLGKIVRPGKFDTILANAAAFFVSACLRVSVCASIVWQFSDKLITMDLEGILSDPLSGALSDPLTSLEGECFNDPIRRLRCFKSNPFGQQAMGRATAAMRSTTHLLIIGCVTSTLLLGGFKPFLSTSILKEDPKWLYCLPRFPRFSD